MFLDKRNGLVRRIKGARDSIAKIRPRRLSDCLFLNQNPKSINEAKKTVTPSPLCSHRSPNLIDNKIVSSINDKQAFNPKTAEPFGSRPKLGCPVYHNNIMSTLNIHLCPSPIRHVLRLPVWKCCTMHPSEIR